MSCPNCNDPLDFSFDSIDSFTVDSCKAHFYVKCYKCGKEFGIDKILLVKNLIDIKHLKSK